MNVSFLDFWYDFEPNNNFFIHLLRSIYPNVNVTDPAFADVIFYTCFGRSHKNYTHCKKIFFTGENIRPNYNECTHSISFDFDTYDSRNIRIPLWYLYIDWFNVGSYGNPNWLVPINCLTNKNEFTTKEKTKFCATVFSSPYNERFNMIQKLNEYKLVDCFGKVHPNRLPEGEKAKLDVISAYKFCICFENTLYPGYYTEKLLHAKVAGTIPIYYSDLRYSEDFNSNCCINANAFSDLNEVRDYIKEIDNDDSLYHNILNQPLFKSIPDLNDIRNKIKNIL